MNINKKWIIVLLAVLLVSPVFSVQKSTQSNKSSKLVITGYVVSKGNVPFIMPAIKTEDGTEYMISCKDKTKQKLLNSQGCLIKFTGKLENGMFVLKKWKIIK
jgi:hypothetical protein